MRYFEVAATSGRCRRDPVLLPAASASASVGQHTAQDGGGVTAWMDWDGMPMDFLLSHFTLPAGGRLSPEIHGVAIIPDRPLGC